MPTVPTFDYEQRYWQTGHTHVAGVDEVGMGALAGPVVAAAVILSQAEPIAGLRDSKQLTPKAREQLSLAIKAKALAWAVGEASVDEITELNIRQAALLAMQRALNALSLMPTAVLIDGTVAPSTIRIPCTLIIKGDALVNSIAAASIVAKVHRDYIMMQLHEQFPDYGLNGNKGYGSASHLAALQTLGATVHHRPTYAPVARALTKQSESTMLAST